MKPDPRELLGQRRRSASQWTTANPVLAAGEPGLETDTTKTKLGDGVTTWVSRPYDAPKCDGSYVHI